MHGRHLLLTIGLFVLGCALSLLLSALGNRRLTGPAGQPSDPQRIISMSPNITECLFALGCGARVVAVTDFCDYPSGAGAKERVGAFVNPNLEKIVALEPDLVIVLGMQEKVARLCAEKGFALLRLHMNDIDSVFSGLSALGRRLGVEDRARSLRAAIRAELDDVSHLVAGRGRPTVFFCMGHNPGSLTGLYTTNSDGLLGEMLDIAGGRNVFADAAIAFPQISKESLLKRAPDVIIDARPGETVRQALRDRLLADWRMLGRLPATRNGRVHVLTEDYLLIPGPRIGQCARRLAEAIHPEAFQ